MLTWTIPRLGSPNAERADAGEAPALLSHDRRDRARDVDVVRGQVHVERDERPARADEHGSHRRIELGRPAVGCQLAGLEPLLEGREPLRPEERRAAGSAQLAVEKDGQAEPLADAYRELQGRRPGPSHVLRTNADERHDVRDADSRMRTLVLPQVDALARARDAGEERLDQLVLLAGEREHGAVVIGIDMNVEEPRPARERLPDGVDRAPGCAPRRSSALLRAERPRA